MTCPEKSCLVKLKNPVIVFTKIKHPEREILLDVLFADNHYPTVIESALETEWLLQTNKPVIVRTPDINSIAGDELTTFALNTTGVPFSMEKEKEIMK